MYKYSVLMSLYKYEEPSNLKKSIESMINQSIPPDEIVIVEDGPITSGLNEVIINFAKNFPGLFLIIKSDNNIGLGLALNLGLKHCKNNLVARMDTDDISLSNRCEKQLLHFKKDENLSIIGSNVDEFCDDETIILSTRKVPSNHDDIYNFSKRRSAFNHPSVMFKKNVVMSLGGYSNLRRNQDLDLFGRILFNGFKASNINESLLLFRANKNLSKRRKSWQNTKSYIGVIYNFKKIGYSSLLDLFIVTIAQLIIFIIPLKLQMSVYKIFLRRK